MQASIVPSRKRPVKLTLSEGLVGQAKTCTGPRSITKEKLLAPYVIDQPQVHRGHRQTADACAADWNAMHDAVGSFADEHSTL